MLLRFFAFSNVLMLALFASAGPWDNVGGVSPDATNQVLIESKAYTDASIAAASNVFPTLSSIPGGAIYVPRNTASGTTFNTNNLIRDNAWHPLSLPSVASDIPSNAVAVALRLRMSSTVLNQQVRMGPTNDANSGFFLQNTATSAEGLEGITVNLASNATLWYFVSTNAVNVVDVWINGYFTNENRVAVNYNTFLSSNTYSSTYTGTVVNGMLRLADDAGVYRASGQWESPTITSASGFTGLTMSVLSQYGGANNSPAETPSSTAGLVAYYKLNGSAVDSVTGSNGTIAGLGDYRTEAVLGSGSFSNNNASSSAFQTAGPTLLHGATGATFSIWVKPTSLRSTYCGLLASRGTKYNGLYMANAGTFGLDINSSGVAFEFTNSIGLSSWIHLLATWSTNSFVKGYVNGTLVYTATSKYVGSITNDDVFKIGWDDGDANRVTVGLFDDAHIYNRPLSDSDVAVLYANSSAHRAQVSLNGGSFVGPDSTTNTYYTGSTALGATQTQAKVRVELSKSSVSNTTPRIYNLAMLNAGGGATVFDTVSDFAQGSFTNTLVDTEPAFPTNMAYVSDVVAATSGAASVVYVTNAVAVATNALYTNSIEWTYVLTTNTYDWTEANLLHDGTNYCLPLPAHIPADAKEVGVAFIAATPSPSAGVGLTIQEKFATYSNTPTAYFPRFPVFPQVGGLTMAAYCEIPVVDRSISYRSNIPSGSRTASVKIIKYRR